MPASSMLSTRNGHFTWALRTPFWRDMMVDLRTSSRKFMTSNTEKLKRRQLMFCVLDNFLVHVSSFSLKNVKPILIWDSNWAICISLNVGKIRVDHHCFLTCVSNKFYTLFHRIKIFLRSLFNSHLQQADQLKLETSENLKYFRKISFCDCLWILILHILCWYGSADKTNSTEDWSGNDD